eukprot:g12115.t2
MLDRDSSDDEFDMGDSKGKGKAPAVKPTKKKDAASMLSLDDLLEESTRAVARAKKISAIMGLGDDIIKKDLRGTELQKKERTDKTEAEDKRAHKAIMDDTSIDVPGAIQVFRWPQEASPDRRFSPPRPGGELSVLSEAVKHAETDPAELEELLREGLVPWVKQKLKGKAPPEVCRWLLGLVAQHEETTLVMAAEDALVQLLAEDGKGWRLRYQDTVDIWWSCGAVWLATGGGGDTTLVDGQGDDEEDEDDDDDEPNEHLKRNLRSALNVVVACFRRGAYEMNPAELREMLQDLLAASLDKGVSGSCQTEVGRALVAVVDAMPAWQFEDTEAFSSLLGRLCDPSARALKSRMTPLSWVLLARNVPFKRSSSSVSSSSTSPSGSGVVAGVKAGESEAAKAAPSLRHQVCHRLLTELFLSDTSYVDAGESPEGLGRALKALRVLLDDEDDLLEDESEDGFQRQYVVVALASEMAAGSVVASQTRKPDAEESKEMVRLLNGINKELTNIMQGTVQMSKTLLDLMRSKYMPFLPVSSGRQSKLSFAKTSSGGGGESASDDDDEEDSTQGSQ